MGDVVMARPRANATTPDSRLEAMLLKYEIEQFNNTYAAALDEQRLLDWVEMFTDDALYNIVSRENYQRNLPVGLIYCENKGMIRDRAFALKETAMFAPRYLTHLIANQQVVREEADGTIIAQANYVVLQVLFDRPDATLHQVGTYYDKFRRTDDGIKLAERQCVYSNLLVPNALCLPV